MAPTFSCAAASKLPFLSKRTSFFKANVLKQQNLNPHENNWITLSSEIHAHVLSSLPKTPPPPVSDPMRYLFSIVSPSIASTLCLAACELVGGRRDQAMGAACAVELMHAGSCTHSQLLSCKLQQPRGGVQLMTGDGLLLLGYEMAARGGGDPERIVRVVLEMTKAMGAQGVLEGQLMEAEGRGEEWWRWERSSGRLAACGAACGAIMGGGSEEEVARVRRFGMHVGMMTACMSDDERHHHHHHHHHYIEVVEIFKSFARLELEGFEDEENVAAVLGLFKLEEAAGGSKNTMYDAVKQ